MRAHLSYIYLHFQINLVINSYFQNSVAIMQTFKRLMAKEPEFVDDKHIFAEGRLPDDSKLTINIMIKDKLRVKLGEHFE